MRIFYGLRHTIIDLVWTFYLKSVQVSKIFGTYFLSYQRDKLAKAGMQPSSSLPEHQLQPSSPYDATIVTAKFFLLQIKELWSTATKTVFARHLPLTDYISGAENGTQRDLSGHTNGNIEMRSPSATAMIVRTKK